MCLRRTLSSAALVAAAASACTPPGTAGDANWVLTREEATNAMLVADDLPGVWRTTAVPVRRGRSVPDLATSASECGRATREVAGEASRWGAAGASVEAAWETPAGDMLLKQEIASDRDLEAGPLANLLERQARECATVVVVADGVTVESQLRSCDLSRGEPGIQIVQSWTASDGRSGSTRLGYILRRHILVVLTYTSSDAGDSCEHAAFDRVVAAAATKVPR